MGLFAVEMPLLCNDVNYNVVACLSLGLCELCVVVTVTISQAKWSPSSLCHNSDIYNMMTIFADAQQDEYKIFRFHWHTKNTNSIYCCLILLLLYTRIWTITLHIHHETSYIFITRRCFTILG